MIAARAVRVVLPLFAALAAGSSANAGERKIFAPEDALGAQVHTDDADRFVAVFAASESVPDATALEREYLGPGSPAVEIFTPHRIQSAENLAAAIAKNPDEYRDAIDRCLPVVKDSSRELQAIYLALHGLFPDRALPQVHALFGAGNSGGTAADGAQVLGVEVLCTIASDDDALREMLRMFFAHETAHTWQKQSAEETDNALLFSVLHEGAADYVASLVLGREPMRDKSEWALPREQELWEQLSADIALLDEGDAVEPAEREAAMRRWVGNYGVAPDGWPYEVGYWMGMRIWQRFVAASPEIREAARQVIDWTDAREVLRIAGAPEN